VTGTRPAVTALILGALLTGCATFANLQADREAGKGTTRAYAVSMDDAWRISKTVLRWEGGNAIDETREGGYRVTGPETALDH
jgi:hypothetical protein